MITNDAGQVKIFRLDNFLNKIINHMASNDFISEIFPTQEINPTEKGEVGEKEIINHLKNPCLKKSLSARSGQPDLSLVEDTRIVAKPILQQR